MLQMTEMDNFLNGFQCSKTNTNITRRFDDFNCEEDGTYLAAGFSRQTSNYGVETSFFNKIRAEEDGSPTPTNAQRVQNDSPTIAISPPVANLNPFLRKQQSNQSSTSPRPCVAGTQSVKHKKSPEIISETDIQSSIYDPSLNSRKFKKKDLNKTSLEVSFNNSASNTSGIISDFSNSLLTENSSISLNNSDNSFSEFLSSIERSSDKRQDDSSTHSTASAILSSILKESSTEDDSEISFNNASNCILDDNLALMSKYVEELTGFPSTAASIPSRKLNKNDASVQFNPKNSQTEDKNLNKRLNTIQALYSNSNQVTKDLVARYLANSNDPNKIQGQNFPLQYSPPVTSARNASGPGGTSVFNFNDMQTMAPSRPQRLSTTSADLSNVDIALLNTLSNLQPNTLATLFKSMERNNITNYMTNGTQPSLSQSLEALATLQQQIQLQQQLLLNYEASKLTGNLSSTDLGTLLTLVGLQQSQSPIFSQDQFPQNSKTNFMTSNNSNRVHLSGQYHGTQTLHNNRTGHLNTNSAQKSYGFADQTNVHNYLSNDIELAATSYRNSASSVAQRNEVPMKWDGDLPSRNYQTMTFSRKVFLGGVPWETTSDALIQAFSEFGNLSVNWPQSGENGLSSPSFTSSSSRKATGPKGYCYLIFEYEHSVSSLLSKCRRDIKNGEYYYSMITSKLVHPKDVQVIPWNLNDSQFGKQSGNRQESNKTVFIGALHGMITAEALAQIMSNLFGNVFYAAIDTDKYKYPIGSGRVIFSNEQSYFQAVSENFVEVRTNKFNKIIQIDPYLEDSLCSKCQTRPGIYFCRAFVCFSYFCPACWSMWHNTAQTLYNHKPLRRSWRQTGGNNERSGTSTIIQ